MIGYNIKLYRLLRHLSQEELATKTQLTKMAISNYESGKRTPDSAVLLRLADALETDISKLLVDTNEFNKITHGAFRKSNLSKIDTELLFAQMDRKLVRYCAIFEILGENAFPVSETPRFKFTNELDASTKLRKFLGLAETGPVGNLVDIFENKGIIVCLLDANNNFSGNNGTAGNHLYVALNINMSYERQRFTMMHELCHILFAFPDDVDAEKTIDRITGLFFLPSSDLYRELGVKRNNIQPDLASLKREYGVSVPCILTRAYQCKIISRNSYYENNAVARDGETSNSAIYVSTDLLERLVSRAYSEQLINRERMAELIEDV